LGHLQAFAIGQDQPQKIKDNKEIHRCTLNQFPILKKREAKGTTILSFRLLSQLYEVRKKDIIQDQSSVHLAEYCLCSPRS
jgi:hypothetical protein